MEKKISKKKCGIIMPISASADYSMEHWQEVLTILVEALSETEFEPRLVSDDVAIGLIHERIVNNIYSDEIVVCDVSSKNPNVMFELGMRLAFDKPTIIIKDENTGYSFDTGVIEHINYPSSLRFNKIVEFKKELVKKINATYKKSTEEDNFSPFLKSFGKTIVPAKIKGSEIPESQYILSKLEMISDEIQMLKIQGKTSERQPTYLYNGNEIGGLAKRNMVTKTVIDFIERNHHLDLPEILGLTSVINEEVNKNIGVNTSRDFITKTIQNYFERKIERK